MERRASETGPWTEDETTWVSPPPEPVIRVETRRVSVERFVDRVEVGEASTEVHRRGLIAQRLLAASREVDRLVPRPSITLPANPFSDLSARELAAFVECTLGEVTGLDPHTEPGHHEMAPLRPRRLLAPVRARSFAPHVAACLACLLIGLVGGTLLRWPSGPAAATLDPAPRPSLAPPPAPPEPAVVAAADPPPAAEVCSGTASAPAVSRASAAPLVEPAATCQARITTEPPGADVFWNDQPLGTSPIESADIGCGSGTITLRLGRYTTVTRTLEAKPDEVLAVSQVLRHPNAELVVGSSPPGAIIAVDRTVLGQAPVRITVPRFETREIVATLPGHLPWVKNVYVRDPETRVGMKLEVDPTESAAAASLGIPEARIDLPANNLDP